MEAFDLLKTWPGWANAGAETVLASPAWRLPVRVGEAAGWLKPGASGLTDSIDLDVALDGEPHVLSLADSPLLSDLHLLWRNRAGLPPEVVLALLEKECGDVFAMLEQATRRLFEVKGLAAAPAADARRLDVVLPGGVLPMALDLSPEIRAAWGRLENLDVTHPALRAQTRPARVEYCSLALSESERQALAAGDHLVLPDTFDATQRWIVENPDDGDVHLCSQTPLEIAFGDFADGTLPAIPAPAGELLLLCRGNSPRACTPARLGAVRTVLIS